MELKCQMTPRTPSTLPASSIFKAYDIRGIVGETLDKQTAWQIGYAFGTSLHEINETLCIVGRDGRLSGPDLSAALMSGLCAAGIDVIDLGMVTTPMTYFATHVAVNGWQAKSSIMVTGSHNPPNYNGFKMVRGGEALYGEKIQTLYQCICAQALAHHEPQEKESRHVEKGLRHVADIAALYQQRIVTDIKLARPIKIAIDCGNGVAGGFAPALFRALGCEVTELFCTIDGHFPNHHPDPAHIENLQDLMRCLQETDCELGLAFDGDGDRLGIVTKDGEVIFPDRQLMLFAQDVLQRHPGQSIIYDVKCSAQLAPWIRQHGGVPLMWKTGHSFVKAKLKEMAAPLAGEMSGHLFFKDRWYGFDDGLYAGARLLELLSRSPDANAVLHATPHSISTPELQLQCHEGEAFEVLEKMKVLDVFSEAQEILTIDGIRAEYSDGFGLARASNTTPVIVMRFEADNPAALLRIQTVFKQALLTVKPDAQFSF